MSATTLHRVIAADRTALAVEEAGDAKGRPLVFVHGIAQSRHVWRPLLEGPLARDFRLVALDLRGHGESGAPAGAEAYASGDRLGGDLRAVIDSLSLARPVLVAWSYGGVAVGEYLRRFGSGGLGGLFLVAASVVVGRAARAWFGPTMMNHARALMSDDAAVYEAGARAFCAESAATPRGAGELDRAVRAMLGVPAHVRRALLSRGEDYSAEIAACEAPVATLHGTLDRVVWPALSRHVASLRPGVRSFELEGVGHLPWLEAPEPFESALRSWLATDAGGPAGAPSVTATLTPLAGGGGEVARHGSSGARLAVGAGGRARPAFEGAVKGAHFGEPEHEGDLGDRLGRLFEVPHRKITPHLVEQRLQRRGFVRKVAL
jgi:pimeloyl-ACP methyl ester carboxylesterase